MLKVLSALCGALVLVALGAQAGLWKGRLLEREQMAADLAQMRRLLDEAGERLEELETRVAAAEIIECESNGRHDGVWGDGGQSYGIAQFKKGTFDYLKKKAGEEGFEWKRREDQLALLRWALKNGYGGHWACYRG